MKDFLCHALLLEAGPKLPVNQIGAKRKAPGFQLVAYQHSVEWKIQVLLFNFSFLILQLIL